MKKFLLVCLIALVAIGVYADSNNKWTYSKDYGLYHLTSDIAFLTENNMEVCEDEEILMTFSKVGDDIGVIFAFDEKFNLGGITNVTYADSIDTIDETGTPFEVIYSGEESIALSIEDSYFIYMDMLSSTQKMFAFVNVNDSSTYVLFNVNCKDLYKYRAYLK